MMFQDQQGCWSRNKLYLVKSCLLYQYNVSTHRVGITPAWCCLSAHGRTLHFYWQVCPWSKCRGILLSQQMHPRPAGVLYAMGRKFPVYTFTSQESSHCQLFYSLTEAPLVMDALAPMSRSMEPACLATGREATDLTGFSQTVIGMHPEQ